MWGISGVTATYAAAFTLGVLIDRGDLDAAAEAALDEARDLPWVGEGGRLMRESAARLLLEQGRAEEALDELTAPVDYPEVRNPAWAPWRGLMARALAALGRTDEAVALADEEVALLRRWGAPIGARRRRCGSAASCAGPRASPTSARPSTCSPAPARRWRRPAPSWRSARAPGVADAEAVPLLRGGAAHGPRLWCAAASPRTRSTALAQRGHAHGRRGRRPPGSPAGSGG